MTDDANQTTFRRRASSVVLAAPDEPIGRCLDRLADANVGSIVVVDAERVVGILTERDVLRRWRQLGQKGFLTTPIRDVATSPVFTMRFDELGEAPREMLERRIRHVPLVDRDDKLVGIMSMRDILAAQLKAKTLPMLRPVAKDPAEALAKAGRDIPPAFAKASAGTERAGSDSNILHLLTPTGQLTELCKRFLPQGWRCQVWSSIGSIENLPAVKSASGLARTAFMLDLDGVAHADWKRLIRRFIQMLTSTDQPAIFLAWTSGTFSEKEVESLLEVARKARWHAYQRPLAVPALASDLAALEDAAEQVSKQ